MNDLQAKCLFLRVDRLSRLGRTGWLARTAIPPPRKWTGGGAGIPDRAAACIEGEEGENTIKRWVAE